MLQCDASNCSHTIRVMRKAPQQDRSRQMVERIVSAGRTVLMRDGYAAFSTNRVADEADISPGSLYQYFPNKAAIIDVIVDRYWSEVAERVTASLLDNAADLGPTAVTAVVEALVAALEQDAELLRVVTEELPVVRLKSQRAALEQRIRDLAGAYLALVLKQPPHVAAQQAWMLVIAVEATTLRWVLDRPAIDRAAFVTDLSALVNRFLGL